MVLFLMCVLMSTNLFCYSEILTFLGFVLWRFFLMKLTVLRLIYVLLNKSFLV